MDSPHHARPRGGGGCPRRRLLARVSQPRPVRCLAKFWRLDAADCDQCRARPASPRGRGGAVRAPADAGAEPASVPVPHDLRDALRLAFGRLPPRLAAVASLALIEQQSYADIAEALDVPIGTVKSRVFRATRMLREELARLGFTS